MTKKFFIVTALLVIFSLFAIPYTFAANNNMMNNAVNNVRNFVGGTENVIEDAGKGVVNGISNSLNAVENGAKNITNDMTNNQTNNYTGASNNTGYSVTRTTAEATPNGGLFANMSSNVLTWSIMAILAIAIIALVLYYARQNPNATIYHGDDDNDNG